MSATKIQDTIALVTGANRGIGRAIVEALLDRGAAKVYAGARNTDALSDLTQRYGDRVVPLQLDVTDDAQVVNAASSAGDVRLLINNAGVAVGGQLSAVTIVDNARKEMEVNYFAPLNLLQRFSPVLIENGGGTVVNISSVAGLTNFPFFPTYSASKAAVHSLTQASRILLSSQGVTTLGVYPGPVDTAMAEEIDLEKASPRDVANRILDGIEAGTEEIYPDTFAVEFGRQFESSPKASERQISEMITTALAS